MLTYRCHYDLYVNKKRKIKQFLVIDASSKRKADLKAALTVKAGEGRTVVRTEVHIIPLEVSD